MTDTQMFTDDALVSNLPGFTNEYIDVNGTTLHVVTGGQGMPLFLLPGWPQTWWAYHKIMQALSLHFKVVAVDIRGMGSSGNPESGYDKKTMAQDIKALSEHLGFHKICLVGHDISASIVHSFAGQFQEATEKVIFLDTPPLTENVYKLPMLQPPGSDGGLYPWWIAFNQVPEVAEQLLENRSAVVLSYIFDGLSVNKNLLTEFDKSVYTHCYDQKQNIRSASYWYKNFPQDIVDSKSLTKLKIPVLGIVSEGNEMMKSELALIAEKFEIITIKNSGHFIPEEHPEQLTQEIISFLK